MIEKFGTIIVLNIGKYISAGVKNETKKSFTDMAKKKRILQKTQMVKSRNQAE